MSIRQLFRRLASIVRRRHHERDLAEEIECHRAMMQRDLEAEGLHATDAAIQARRQLGNLTMAREDARAVCIWPWLESVCQDGAYAIRRLRRQPGFTVVAILTLALGIGANTATLSLVDAVRTRALPYPNADRLVELWGTATRARVERSGASYPDYLEWRAQAKSF